MPVVQNSPIDEIFEIEVEEISEPVEIDIEIGLEVVLLFGFLIVAIIAVLKKRTE